MMYEFRDRCENYNLKNCDHAAAKGEDKVI